MTKRFNDLSNFMESVRALTAQATELKITSETISHMCALDSEFTQIVENLSAIFTATTTPTTTPTEPEESEEEHPQMVVETTPEIIIPEESKESVTVYWKEVPGIPDTMVNESGEVKILVNGTWTPGNIKMYSGYMKFYHPGTRKYYSLAKAVLSAYEGVRDNSYAPIYMDADKSNCCRENLKWGLRDSSLSTSAIEKACKLIAENSSLSESDMINLLTNNHTIKSVTAYRSILAGNYKTISDRYFVVRRGSIIPTTTETTTVTTTIHPAPTEPEVDDSGNLRGILSLTNDPEFVRKLYSERVDAKKVSADDQVALILSYIMDGKDSAPDIQRAIRKDFGKRVMISNTEIQRIIG